MTRPLAAFALLLLAGCASLDERNDAAYLRCKEVADKAVPMPDRSISGATVFKILATGIFPGMMWGGQSAVLNVMSGAVGTGLHIAIDAAADDRKEKHRKVLDDCLAGVVRASQRE